MERYSLDRLGIAMLLYVIRHAESAPPDGAAGDGAEEWHVTDQGRRSATQVAAVAARELGFRPHLILASPCAAAQETVAPLQEALGGHTDVATEPAVDADAGLGDFYRALGTREPIESVAIVTHVPLISRLLPDLLGADSPIELPQGGIACVQCRDGLRPGAGELIWLLPPKRWFDGKGWAAEEAE